MTVGRRVCHHKLKGKCQVIFATGCRIRFTDNINPLNFFSITEEEEQLETRGFLELLQQNSLQQEAIFKLSTDAILPP